MTAALRRTWERSSTTRTPARGAALDDPRTRGAVIGTLAVCVPLIVVLWRFVDPVLSQWSATYGQPWAKWVGRLGRAEVWLIPAAALFAISMLAGWRRPTRWTFMTMVVVAASGIIAVVLKVLIGRPRPGWDPAHDGMSTSFPSGHVTTVASVAALLVLIHPRLWPLALALVAAVGAARVCDHGHYVSDVLAGAMLGVSVTLLIEWGWTRWQTMHHLPQR